MKTVRAQARAGDVADVVTKKYEIVIRNNEGKRMYACANDGEKAPQKRNRKE